MSRRVAAVVCEGPSDFWILSAMILELWPDVEEVRSLQPPMDSVGNTTNRSGGWSEVRAWCLENAERLDELLSADFGDPIDILVIAMDVDIAIEAGIEDPPTEATPYVAKRLCDKVKSWLTVDRKRRLPAEVVIALPAMAVEAWVIAAYYPRARAPEANPAPAGFLLSKGKLQASATGKAIKSKVAYRVFGTQIVAKMKRVQKACPEALRFCQKVLARQRQVDAPR